MFLLVLDFQEEYMQISGQARGGYLFHCMGEKINLPFRASRRLLQKSSHAGCTKRQAGILKYTIWQKSSGSSPHISKYDLYDAIQLILETIGELLVKAHRITDLDAVDRPDLGHVDAAAPAQVDDLEEVQAV